MSDEFTLESLAIAPSSDGTITPATPVVDPPLADATPATPLLGVDGTIAAPAEPKPSNDFEQEIAQMRRENEQMSSLMSKMLDDNKATPDVVSDDEWLTKFDSNPMSAIEEKFGISDLKAEIESLKGQLSNVSDTAHKTDAANALVSLAGMVPDYENIMRSTEFNTYIQSNATMNRMLVAANESMDVKTVAEILNMYKGAINTPSDTPNSPTNPLSESRGGGVVGVNKPTYKRSDILKLMSDNPTEFAKHKKDIALAFAENRVIR